MTMQKAIKAVQDAGFDVYMRNPTDSWLIFTDGSKLGMLSNDRLAGYVLSTVHKPNTRTGTGYRLGEVDRLDKDTLSRAFVLMPDWGRDGDTVKKYRDIEDYRSGDSFNAAYKRIERAQ